MVRMYGAQMSDVTDRAARQVGRVALYDPSLVYNVYIGSTGLDVVSPGLLSLYAAGYGYALNGATWDRLRCNYKNLLTRERPWQNRIPSGRVAWQDDFEDTLKWVQTAGTVTRANDVGYVFSKSYALKAVTGAVAGNNALARLELGPPAEGSTYATAGVFLALNAAVSTTPRDIYMTWVVQDRSFNVQYIFGVRYSHYEATVAQQKLQYFDLTSSWVDLVGGGCTWAITTPQFRYLELTIKRTASAWGYSKVRFDDRTFDLDVTAAPTAAFTHEEQSISLGCHTDIAAATTAYFDDFTLVDTLGERP